MLSGRKTATTRMKVLTILFTLLFLLWTSTEATAVTLSPGTKAKLELSREISRTKILLDEEFTVTYKVKPEPIPATAVKQPDREIYLVIDTSGSMEFNLDGNTIPKWSRQKRRLDIAKEAAFRFLEQTQR